MPEQNTNEPTPNLIAQLAANRDQINNKNFNEAYQECELNQRPVNNRMNGLGMEDKKLDKGMDI